MQREFYKLIVVFMMILLSFSLAFFLGREMSLWDQHKNKAPPSPPADQVVPSGDGESGSSANRGLPAGEGFSDRQRVHSYQSVLEVRGEGTPQQQKPEGETAPDRGEAASDTENKGLLKKPVPDPLYALLVARSETKAGAVDKSSQIKMRFPQWSVFFKWVKGQYRVYIGPFKEKEAALKFLKDMQEREKEFEILKLEEIQEVETDRKS